MQVGPDQRRRKDDRQGGLTKAQLREIQKAIHDAVGHVCPAGKTCSCGATKEP